MIFFDFLIFYDFLVPSLDDNIPWPADASNIASIALSNLRVRIVCGDVSRHKTTIILLVMSLMNQDTVQVKFKIFYVRTIPK